MLEFPGQTAVGVTVDVHCRAPKAADGAALFRLIGETGTLERNSAYAYVMMADLFGDTCALAELSGRSAGCLIGFRPPRVPNALFVWQIGVLPEARRRGIAPAMIDHVLGRSGNRDLDEVLTTVDRGNSASEHMFRAFAAHRGAHIEEAGGYPAELFPDAHESERLFRITGLGAPVRRASARHAGDQC